MMNRAKIVHVSTDTDNGFDATIIVSRFPGPSTRRPHAADVPADIREAIREWLATADEENPDVTTP